MAIAAGQELGLYINGESAEPASGDLRDLAEPATGAALAVAALWVVLMYGPETLLHCEDAVYDADGTYHGLR